jgi:hypothetical protein
MRTRNAFAFAAALLVLAICASCGGGGGGGGGSAGGDTASDGQRTVALTWRGSDGVTGYVVHWGAESHAYAHEVDVQKPVADAAGNVTVMIALGSGDVASTYFFAITSYDAVRNSSDFSNELSIDTATL